VDDRYALEVLADNPLRYWRLQDEAGTTNLFDEKRTTTITPTNVGLRRRGPWRGQREVSALFDPALSARGGLAAAVGLTGTCSFEWWHLTVSADATSGYAGTPALTVFGDTSGGVWMQSGVHGGKTRWARFNNSAWQYLDSVKAVNDGAWHHNVVTYNSSTRLGSLYVDGFLDNTVTITAHQNQGGVNAISQGYSGNVDHFDGHLAELAIYNTELSAYRVRAHYLAGRRALYVAQRRGLLRVA
jgi:hypothetical protein